jgi:hypothetical protein
VLGCGVFAKVLDNLRRKLGVKAFRGVMVGYSHNSPCYRVCNPAIRRITTFVHVKFHETIPGFGNSHHVNSLIDVFFDANDDSAAPVVPSSADMSPDTVDLVDTVLGSDKPTRVRGPLAHFEDCVAHVSTIPRMFATNACSLDLSGNVEDVLALSNFFMMVARPRHKSIEGAFALVALVSTSVCVEPAFY